MELMTLEEVAKYLRVTTKTIYRLLEKQTIPAQKVGRQWRFDKTSIDTWLCKRPAEKSAKILVIDDDETICTLFKDTLEGSNHNVTTVNQSSEGLELVKNQDYDLVFLDLKMPVMDGAELFKQIRLLKPKLPVTIITGYPDSYWGMTCYVVTKPINNCSGGVRLSPLSRGRRQVFLKI